MVIAKVLPLLRPGSQGKILFLPYWWISLSRNTSYSKQPPGVSTVFQTDYESGDYNTITIHSIIISKLSNQSCWVDIILAQNEVEVIVLCTWKIPRSIIAQSYAQNNFVFTIVLMTNKDHALSKNAIIQTNSRRCMICNNRKFCPKTSPPAYDCHCHCS